MPRPPPPITPDSYEAFVQHASKNLHAWFEYIQQAISYSDTLELQNTYLQNQIDKEKGIQDYQHQMISELQDKHAKAVANERHALTLAVPTVNTPISSQSPPMQPIDPASVPCNPTITTTSAAPTHTSGYPSERFPDPEQFNGERADLRRFTTQMVAKMTSNADRFPKPYNRVAYTINRLSGKAFKQVMPYIDSTYSQFPDYTDVLELLDKAFGDPNEADTARRDLLRFKQNNRDFNTFIAEFQRLAVESKYPKDALPTMLEDKLSLEMQALLKVMPPASTEYHAFIQHLQELDRRNQKFAASALRTWVPNIATNPPAPLRQLDRGQPTGEPMDLSQRRTIPPLTDTERQRLRHLGACFRCRKPGHMATQCPDFPPTLKPVGQPLRPRAAIDSHSHHSDSDSENGRSLNNAGSRDYN